MSAHRIGVGSSNRKNGHVTGTVLTRSIASVLREELFLATTLLEAL
jgi:hypothetical protein